ncbi:MAG: hypothetical protein Q8O94_00900 [bacterium]|nr:hypothetical protein [bacterium]
MSMRSLVIIIFALCTLAPIACLPVGRALAQPQTGPTIPNSQTQEGPTIPKTSSPTDTLINPLGAGTNLPALLNQIMKFVVYIGSIVVIFMLVYVGFLFVTAQGNETEITEARKALLWTVVGALILLGAEAISLGIQATVQALSTGN